MGGQLSVSSQINIGTQFWFELALPIVDYDIATAYTRQQIIGIKGEPPKILVVDDNLANQAVLVDLLSPLFYIESADNGREGLEKAIKWQPDVIITDLIMPEMAGLELIRQLRQSPLLKQKIIIATSGSARSENGYREKKREYGSAAEDNGTVAGYRSSFVGTAASRQSARGKEGAARSEREYKIKWSFCQVF